MNVVVVARKVGHLECGCAQMACDRIAGVAFARHVRRTGRTRLDRRMAAHADSGPRAGSYGYLLFEHPAVTPYSMSVQSDFATVECIGRWPAIELQKD
jgi:hypothetical protein